MIIILVVLMAQLQEISRSYHAVTTKELSTTAWTHVCVDGRVMAFAAEPDGDYHVALSNFGTTIIAEFIPTLKPLRGSWEYPRPNSRIRVCGISRMDKKHRWAEVHPVESWMELP